MINIHVVIPARLKSTRLPGKMLADIAGKPMIQRVYEQVSKTKFKSIIIATDSQEIKDVAEGFGAKVILTRDDHESGTDRIAEAVTSLGFDNEDIVVNVQGDEPLIPVENTEQAAQLLIDKPEAVVSTLCERIIEAEDIYNPNTVKVDFDENKYALYFSRASIPISCVEKILKPGPIPKANTCVLMRCRSVPMYCWSLALPKPKSVSTKKAISTPTGT